MALGARHRSPNYLRRAVVGCHVFTQQVLHFLVQSLRSAELGARQSHFAFVISRAVKRQSFEWANRERTVAGIRTMAAELVSALLVEEPFERHAMPRHFLHRCVSKGLLHDAELDLLIQFKLEGTVVRTGPFGRHLLKRTAAAHEAAAG